MVRIEDDGPGFSPEVIELLGEPYVSRRQAGGLGLGVFIAQTLLARTGATLHFANLDRGCQGDHRLAPCCAGAASAGGFDMTKSAEALPGGAPAESAEPMGGGRSLLLVDDDAPLRRSLTRALERRGFQVLAAEGLAEAKEHARLHQPEFAVLDMRLTEGSGLDLVQDAARACDPSVRIVIVTGYGNIATAVAAIKAGAVDYLAKPVDADDVVNALLRSGDGLPPPPDNPMSADRVRWEHIQRVFEQCHRNVSETARRLNMHRRTLQRILNKRAPARVAGARGLAQPRPARVSKITRQAPPPVPRAVDRRQADRQRLGGPHLAGRDVGRVEARLVRRAAEHPLPELGHAGAARDHHIVEALAQHAAAVDMQPAGERLVQALDDAILAQQQAGQRTGIQHPGQVLGVACRA